MKVISVYARLYARCLVEALAGVGRNLWTLALPMSLGIGLYFVAVLVSPLGRAGGILVAFAESAALSIWSYFSSEVVAHSKVGLSDFPRAIRSYFWSWVSLSFVLYILNLLVSTALANNPNRDGALTALNLITLVALTAAPEVITQKGTRTGLDTIQRSFAFLQETWIEWFIPNLLILGGAYLFVTRVMPGLSGPAVLLSILGACAVAHVVAVFRGHLFRELDGSTHRQRMYRFRTGG